MKPGDRVRSRQNGKEGTVMCVDGKGDPSVQFDGEEAMDPKYAEDFEVMRQANGIESGKLGIQENENASFLETKNTKTCRFWKPRKETAACLEPKNTKRFVSGNQEK